MKYLLIIVGVIAFVSAGLTGYLYFNPGFLVGSQNANPSIGQSDASGQIQELNARIKQLQDELFDVRNTANQQALAIAKLTVNNSRIDDFYAKLKELQMSAPEQANPSTPGVQSTPEFQASLSKALAGTFTPEFFQNPEYAKLFVAKVEEAIKVIEQKQQEERMARIAEQAQKRIAQRIDEFAKAQNLNDYQKQELSNIIAERAAKSLELFNQMRQNSDSGQQLTPEQMRAQLETLKTESNEKVKQVLLPNQYEEYQKVENSLTGGRGMGGRQGGRGNQPSPAPGGTGGTSQPR